jgi:hypothetical protein
MPKERKLFNCPNCGAPIAAEKCPYCGTVIYDFSCIDTEEVNWIKIKHNGRVFMCRARMLTTTVEAAPHYYTPSPCGVPHSYVMQSMSAELSMHFVIIPDEQGVLYKSVEV